MSEFTQEGRLIAIDTPLGPDVLLLRSFTGTEGMSQIFRFRLDMLSTDFNINFDDIVGKRVTIRILLEDGSYRYLNGYISRFAQLPVEGHLARYEAEMVPWLWFLTRAADCRIFQEKSVPDIISKVFKDYGFSDFELKLQKSYEPRVYCVQYRETAANFVMRLMEEEGIFFFFRHENGSHVMVIGDAPSVHQPIPQQPLIRYEHTLGPAPERGEDVITEWRYEHELRTGRYALNDYNFETPSTSLLSQIDSTIDQGGNKKYEVYDYPGDYLDRSRGDKLVRLRIEEEETPHEVVSGASNCRALAVGFAFELTDHERRDQNVEYVVTSIAHSGHSGAFIAGTPGEGASYANRFTCIPSRVPYRPLRKTPKPVVEGVQTAVVVGPSGEEIYTDKYGRVKVQFHWDRLGKKNEKSSCWIRVSEPWAGKNWGAVFLPRIGQEVIVDFLEGDPDRPIITGRVYNAEQMPPYKLPDHQTRSGIKTRSTKGGGGSNYNEIRFEDKKGQEEIHIHAERNLRTMVEADETRTVGGQRTTTIQKDDKLTVKEGDRIVIVEQKDHKTEVSMGNHDTQVKMGNRTAKISMGNEEVEVSLGNVTHKAPVGTYKVEAMTVKVQATAMIELVCGASKITMNPGMIIMQAPLIKIN